MYAGMKKKRKQKDKANDRDARKKDNKHKDNNNTGSGKKNSSKEENEIDVAAEQATNIRVGDVQMLESIGRGGFGHVYRGINLLTGEVVAVKRVPLHGIPQEELDGIQMEIKLLKNLDHENIVKYVDALKQDEYLNIILEYVENGALSNTISKLLMRGHVEEQLVAVYTAQILEGLVYLHEQGVIHRDIKGANLLSTKEGVVKLADFGVATRLNDSKKSDSVVGTPYWMAPEIIEMTGQQSSACDIWSVGCTVVELITGKPPYYDLQQMPALFRIVQDEHPPLPDNISPACEDFLMQCFQKDPLRRITARALLHHPWLRQANESRSRKALIFESTRSRTSSLARDEASQVVAQMGTIRSGSVQLKSPPAGLAAMSVNEEDDPFAGMDDDDDDDYGGGDDDDAATIAALKASTAATPHQHPQTAPPGVDRLITHPTGIDEMTAGPTGMGMTANPRFDAAWVEDNDEDEAMDLDDDDIDLDVLDVKHKKLKDEQNQDVDLKEALDDDFDDPFRNMDFDGPDLRSDSDAKLTKQFMRIVARLSHKEDEAVIIKSCEQLEELIRESSYSDQVKALMKSHGVIPIMEMLEVFNPRIIVAVLRLVNMVIGKLNDQKFQLNMTLVGLIPAIIRFASPGFPADIRLEAANFVRHFSYASDYTRKMFIACGGLPVLVGFLEEPYAESTTLVFNAIDCMRHVFEVTTNPKNDFCRLFAKYGVLPPLCSVLKCVNEDRQHPDADEYAHKVANVIHMFSNGDAVVKNYMAKPVVMEKILSALPALKGDILNLLLKSIRNISMEPTTLDYLESAGAIPALVPFLESPNMQIQNYVLSSMYYLSTINQNRQEQAARSGLIPHLQRFIKANHPAKQFALPIMFQLAKTSHGTRLELKKYNGISFFLELLEETYWRTHALDAIAMWLANDTKRVEFILIRSSNINRLITVLKKTKKVVQFEKILGPFVRMLNASRAVNRALGRSNAFCQEVVHRLTTHQNNNNIRMNLLKMLTALYDVHQNPADFIKRHNLVPVLDTISKDESAVMVAIIANELLRRQSP